MTSSLFGLQKMTMLTALACSGAVLPGLQAQTATPLLWELGKPDGNNLEFALAPRGYEQFKEDGLFVVGQSDTQKDWPYVQPGPGDGWAGGRSHTFSVLFGLSNIPSSGECQLRVRLVDTHSRANPQLKLSLNNNTQTHQTPAGGGDESVYGAPAKGKAHAFAVTFPASSLKRGLNELAITTTSGSWILYDWIGFEAPVGAQLAQVEGSSFSSATSPPVLVEGGGELRQLLEFTIRHFGQETSAELQVNGTTVTNVPLRSGARSCVVTVPAVKQETKARLGLMVGGQSVASTEVLLKPVRKWIVYLLPHSHVDIGYTHVQTDVEKAQWKYLEMGIDAARKSAHNPPGSRFKWNAEVLWAVDSYLQQSSPQKQAEFFEAVKAGWVGLDALYGNELTGLCRPEELLRLLRFGAQLAKRTGVPIESAMITDVPGYTWGIVPAFAHSGVKYFSIGPNGGDRIGHTIAAWGDKPFWWMGPNGKDKVLVWMTGTGYYRVFQSPQVLHNYLAGLEAKGYPYEMVHVRHCLGDNGAPDVDFADTVRQWNATYAYPKLVIATTAEMFHAFEKRYGDQLPTAKGDFTPYWEDGAASSARETALNRASADRLTQAETLFALRDCSRYPATNFDAAWRNVLLYDEHTWGAHNSISEPDAPFVKSQWAIKQANALDADKQSRELLRRVLGAVTPGAEPGAVDVYNSCSWERTDLVQLSPALAVAGDVVLDDRQKPIRSQRLSTGELVFVAEKVPPFGAKRFYLQSGACTLAERTQIQSNVLSSPEFTVRVDPQSGAIVSLFSRSLGQELVDAAASPVNDFLYLPGSDLQGLKRNGPVRISVGESGPVLSSIIVESGAPGCRKLTREIRLVAGLPRVELNNIVDKEAVRAKEGVHFGFGFNVPGGEVRMDVPWAVVRPEHDQIPGACKNWFTVQRWVDVSNRKYGVTWATPDAPLVEVGAITANLIGSLSNPTAWLDRVEPSQRIYSWAMNNHWHTNYRAEQEGPTVFRYYIGPHAAFDLEAAARFGTGLAQPLLAAPAKGQAVQPSRLTIAGSGVMATALKPSDDGRALIVRLFAASGKAERARVKWAQPAPRQVWLSDGSEAPVKPCNDSVELPPFGIVTLRAELH